MTRLIYVADPMCSWCYGFGPELGAVADALPQSRIEIVLGGLRAGYSQRMDPALKSTLLSHWQHVADETGLPFCDAALSLPSFAIQSPTGMPATEATEKAAKTNPVACPRRRSWTTSPMMARMIACRSPPKIPVTTRTKSNSRNVGARPHRNVPITRPP